MNLNLRTMTSLLELLITVAKMNYSLILSLMNFHTVKTLGENTKKRKQTSTPLTACWGYKINILGRCELKCRYKNRVRVLEFYVVDAYAPCALSLKPCLDLVVLYWL